MNNSISTSRFRRGGVLLAAGAALVVALAGCAGLPLSGENMTTAGKQEIAWQVMNVVDAGQTVTIARHPDQWREADPVTSPIIGQHPTEKSVYLVMAAYAIGHLAVSRWLDYEDSGHANRIWGTALAVWEWATIVDKGFNVASNARWGIKPWH